MGIHEDVANEFAHHKRSEITKSKTLNCYLGHLFEPAEWEPSRIAYHKRCLRCGKDVDCHDPFTFV